MNEDERARLVGELIDHPHDRARILREARLTSGDRDDLLRLADTADAIWLSAQGGRELEDDPVAAMLGLVPDRACALDSAAMARARKRARLTVSDVASRLRQRGWGFDKGDVFRWEARTAADVPPAVVQAIAEILGTPVEALVSAPLSGPQPEFSAAVRGHPAFRQLVDRWAKVQRVSHAVASAALESRALATVHRGEEPNVEQLLRSLDALVASVERTDEETPL